MGRVHSHSPGWASPRESTGRLIGFVNVARDGDDQAFVLDATVAPEHGRRGGATTLVGLTAGRARQAGASGSTSTSRTTCAGSTSAPSASAPPERAAYRFGDQAPGPRTTLGQGVRPDPSASRGDAAPGGTGARPPRAPVSSWSWVGRTATAHDRGLHDTAAGVGHP
ncbi:GNAT family N-acetyltransferase [Actinomycetospora chibensis]|uniref:GNAT family N-acetyltransferase n=1 Tax=Actinomycetospora chibensis TaxID=663606 RepID=A0ABV9RFP5_9PSEU